MSFIDPEDPNDNDRSELQQNIKHGNKKLARQQEKLNEKQKVCELERVSLDPGTILWMRLQHLTDWLLPPQSDEDDNFGNPQRIDFEVAWNDIMDQTMDEALQQARRSRLLQQHPAFNPNNIRRN